MLWTVYQQSCDVNSFQNYLLHSGEKAWSMKTWDPFYKQWLTFFQAWISNYIHYKVWDEITYPFLNFNGVTAEFQEWISNFISHFSGHVITYPLWD